MDAVSVLFDPEYAGKNIAIGHPTKDPSYAKRFEKIASYSKNQWLRTLLRLFRRIQQTVCQQQI